MRKSRFILALLAVSAVTVCCGRLVCLRGDPQAGRHRLHGSRRRPVHDARLAAQEGRPRRNPSGKGPFTVLAPTDAAFAKVPKSTLAALGADRAKLRSVLLYHVIAGKVPAAKVVKLRSAKTLNGQTVRVRVAGGKVFVGGARVVKTDVVASNGVIHVINQVLIPR